MNSNDVEKGRISDTATSKNSTVFVPVLAYIVVRDPEGKQCSDTASATS
jgi:hypothetical protein